MLLCLCEPWLLKIKLLTVTSFPIIFNSLFTHIISTYVEAQILYLKDEICAANLFLKSEYFFKFLSFSELEVLILLSQDTTEEVYP